MDEDLIKVKISWKSTKDGGIMDMNTNTLKKPLHVEVRLSPDKVVSADLREELDIDPNNILGELSMQPAKYAYWATMEDLSWRKVQLALDKVLHDVRCFEARVDEYILAHDQYLFLRSIREAFEHRKSALLYMLDNPHDQLVLKRYRKEISRLRALQEGQ